MLLTDQVLQEGPASPATLNSLGMVVTIATWALLIGINLWCLRKLFLGNQESHGS